MYIQIIKFDSWVPYGTARIVSSFAKTDHSLKDHWIMLGPRLLSSRRSASHNSQSEARIVELI